MITIIFVMITIIFVIDDTIFLRWERVDPTMVLFHFTNFHKVSKLLESLLGLFSILGVSAFEINSAANCNFCNFEFIGG